MADMTLGPQAAEKSGEAVDANSHGEQHRALPRRA
jgi:hypothetical protein